MNYKTLTFGLVLIIIFGFSINNNKTSSHQIEEENNFQISLLCENNTKLLHLYFIDSKVKIENSKEKFTTYNSMGDTTEVYTNLNYLNLVKGKVYLKNNNGDLLIDKAFENLLIPQYNFKAEFLLDPFLNMIIFNKYKTLSTTSFNSIKSSQNSKFYLNNFAKLSDAHDNLIIAKHDGKWGAINFEGKTIFDFKYNSYDVEKEQITLNGNGVGQVTLLNKIDFANNPEKYILESLDAEIISFDLYVAHKELGVVINERCKSVAFTETIKNKILNAPQASLMSISTTKVKFNGEDKMAGSKTYYLY